MKASTRAWNALPEAERNAKVQEGIGAWKAWAEKHQAAIVGMGGPLGKTKKISAAGIEDISNMLSAYTVVRAESHEAAARMMQDFNPDAGTIAIRKSKSGKPRHVILAPEGHLQPCQFTVAAAGF